MITKRQKRSSRTRMRNRRSRIFNGASQHTTMVRVPSSFRDSIGTFVAALMGMGRQRGG